MPVYQIPEEYWFPPVEEAEDGIVGIGGDLSPQRLLLAYQNGIFPWYDEGQPIIWWSPDPRTVLFPQDFKLRKSLKQSIRNRGYTLHIDTRFEEVISNCSTAYRKGETGTWITPEMQKAYVELFKLGFAHSFEIFSAGKLAGGLYGVSIGKAFFGESMFSLERDASKVALYYLVQFALKNDFHFIDAQVETAHIISLGAVNIPRKEFIRRLHLATGYKTLTGKWRFLC